MKVIKEGCVIPQNRLICEKCGCIFEYDKEDIVKEVCEWEEFDSSLYMNQYHYVGKVQSVQCPTCSQIREISRNIISCNLVPFN